MAAYWLHLTLLIMICALWLLELKFYKIMHHIEEHILITIIALIMAVSFGQVVARYGFNTGWSAALEFNTVLFSWLILFGMSYGIKTNLHIGVDIVLKALPKPLEKSLALFGAVCVIAYGLILLDPFWIEAMGVKVQGGAIKYWAKIFKVSMGAEELRYPAWAQAWFGLQKRVHRWIILIPLLLGLAMVVLRGIQAFVDILTGKREMLISAHEAEDLVEENKNILSE